MCDSVLAPEICLSARLSLQANYYAGNNFPSSPPSLPCSEDEGSRMLESLQDLFLQKQKSETVSFDKKPDDSTVFKKPKSIRRLNKKDISAPCNFKHVSGSISVLLYSLLCMACKNSSLSYCTVCCVWRARIHGRSLFIAVIMQSVIISIAPPPPPHTHTHTHTCMHTYTHIHVFLLICSHVSLLKWENHCMRSHHQRMGHMTF